MKQLIDGYRRFRTDRWPERQRLMQTLSLEGQAPLAVVIACADSRLDPAMIFGAPPGELFVVRNVANLVPPCAPDAAYHGTSAALEFGVRALQVEQIVVLGHAQCGGARALLEGTPPNLSDFVGQWLTIGEPARQRALTCPHGQDRQQACEHEIVRLSLDNLISFRWVRESVEAGRLSLRGFYFAIATGTLMMLGPDGRFAPVPEVTV